MNRMSAVPVVALVVLFSGILYSQNSVSIFYDRDTVFDGAKIVSVIRDDNPAYKLNSTNDSAWRVTSFPLDRADYAFAGTDQKDVFWYRIHLVFPEGLPVKTPGLSLGKIADADETYFNGNLIGKSGGFGDPVLHACNMVRLYEIPVMYILPGSDNVISIRVRNTYRADEMPGRGHYYIGNFDAMKTRFLISGFKELVFPVVYFVFFAYFLLLFSKRTRQTENLFYSLFSFGFAVYSFCRTDIKYQFIDDFNLLQKMEFGSMYFSIATLMAFVIVYYGERHRIFHYAFYAFSALCIIVLLFLSDHMVWYSLNVSVVQYTWIIPLGTMLWVLIRNFRKTVEARIMLLSFAIILAGIFHDILLSRGIQLFTLINFWLTPFSMFLFVVSIAMILSIKFANFMTEIESLNETLEQKVKDRTAKLDQSLSEIRIKDEKIQQELVMAGRVQSSLLPARLPDWKVKVAVRYLPLRQVSGDFYDVIETRDGGNVLLIADVSGHGMPAALHAIIAKKSFAQAIVEEPNLAAVFRRVNREMGKIDTGHYLTSFIVKYDGSGTLLYANAGHPKAIWLSKKSRKIRLLDTQGTVVGIREDADSLFRERSISFEPGDRVILYTDALVERPNTAGEQFGERRLLETVKKFFFDPIEVMLDRTMNEYSLFVEGSENKDDLTIVGMEFPEPDIVRSQSQ